jgi:hypothetical protein
MTVFVEAAAAVAMTLSATYRIVGIKLWEGYLKPRA